MLDQNISKQNSLGQRLDNEASWWSGNDCDRSSWGVF